MENKSQTYSQLDEVFNKAKFYPNGKYQIYLIVYQYFTNLTFENKKRSNH